MKKFIAVFAVVYGMTTFMLSAVVQAQDYSKYYSVTHASEFTIDFKDDLYAYGDHQTAETRAALPHYLNLPFGKDPKQKLDLYLPKKHTTDAPVLLFLHGGGFSEGDRAHYGFIARPYAQHGIITAVASYRLTTAGFIYPAALDDAKSAVIWLYRNVARYGGDPRAIYVSGHSAGAITAAELGVDRSWLHSAGISPSILKGIVLVSGIYDFTKRKPGSASDKYMPTQKIKQEASALLHIKDPVPDAVITSGADSGYAPEDAMKEPSREFADALRAKHVRVNLLVLEGENHIQTVLSLGEMNSVLSAAVVQLIKPETKSGWVCRSTDSAGP